MSIKRVGVIGGGQLAKMMASDARKLGLELIIQTPSNQDPAVGIAAETIIAPVDDAEATALLGTSCDVITFENEFINLSSLKKLADQGIPFRPRLEALTPLLDKYQQRSYLQQIGLPVPRFRLLEPQQGVSATWGFPTVLKARRHGYDGRGTFILADQTALENTWKSLGSPSLLLEEFVPFKSELAVMAARNDAGEIVVYPVVETQQVEQVCRRVFVPAAVNSGVVQQVEAIAKTLLSELEVVGVFGIEFFLTEDDQVLVNEIAPRTHNSGHYTLDACLVSQFEMQLRAVADLPLPKPSLRTSAAVMVNLLGYETATHDYLSKRQQLAALENSRVHWYDKQEAYPGRKLGHTTVLLNSRERPLAEDTARKIESLWYG